MFVYVVLFAGDWVSVKASWFCILTLRWSRASYVSQDRAVSSSSPVRFEGKVEAGGFYLS